MTKFNKFASIKGGVAVGTKRGHVLTKVREEKKTKKNAKQKSHFFAFFLWRLQRKPAVRAKSRKGAKTKAHQNVKQIVREVCGFAPYEKRVIELLRTELDKRALRFAKKRLGSHQRAKRKREEMSGVLRAQRAKASAVAK